MAELARGAAGAGAVRRRHAGAWWLRLPETVPRRNPRATQWAQPVANWRAAPPHLRGLDAAVGLRLRRLFFLLAGSFVHHIGLLGTSKVGYGLIMLPASSAYFAGTFWCRRLLDRAPLGPARRGARSAEGSRWPAASPMAGWRWPACMRCGRCCCLHPLRHRPRRPPALRPGRRGGPFPEGRHRGLAVGLLDDGDGLHGRPSSATAAAPASTR